MTFRRLAIVVAVLLLVVAVPASAPAALDSEEFEECLLDLINEDRADHGAGRLAMAYDLNDEVRASRRRWRAKAVCAI